MAIIAHSLVQPAIVVHDLNAGVDRMYELFRAVPSERNLSFNFNNAVYAFGNDTYLELLDGAHEGHTRARYLERHGPGLYMLCVDLAGEDPARVEEALERAQVRVVQGGEETGNVIAGWHLHPRDAGNILTLLAVKKDLRDNGDWAGHKAAAYVPGNSRVVSELRGVLARTSDPAAEAAPFAKIGMPMAADGPGMRWRGPTGTILELLPAGAWPGDPVSADARDYALCFATADLATTAARFEESGLTGAMTAGRWISAPDPVLGCRIALESVGV